MTSVTIQIDDELHARLRELAASQNLTVAEMAQRLVDVRSAPPVNPTDLGPVTRAASGVAPPMSDAQVQELLDQERVRKHGK